MTKWARMRRRKERKRADEEQRSQTERKEEKLNQPEKISENIQYSQEIEKPEITQTDPSWNTKNSSPPEPKTILAQIPRYAYLLAIFTLLSGVFFPLITPGVPMDLVVQGTAALFLGLAGGILLFKATSNKNRGIFIAAGFALIAISLALIYHVRDAGFFQEM